MFGGIFTIFRHYTCIPLQLYRKEEVLCLLRGRNWVLYIIYTSVQAPECQKLIRALHSLYGSRVSLSSSLFFCVLIFLSYLLPASLYTIFQGFQLSLVPPSLISFFISFFIHYLLSFLNKPHTVKNIQHQYGVIIRNIINSFFRNFTVLTNDKIRTIRTNRMHYLLSIYFNN